VRLLQTNYSHNCFNLVLELQEAQKSLEEQQVEVEEYIDLAR